MGEVPAGPAELAGRGLAQDGAEVHVGREGRGEDENERFGSPRPQDDGRDDHDDGDREGTQRALEELPESRPLEGHEWNEPREQDEQEARGSGRPAVERRLDLRRRAREPRQDRRRRPEEDHEAERAEDRDSQDEEHAAGQKRPFLVGRRGDRPPPPGDQDDRKPDERAEDPDEPARDPEIDERVHGEIREDARTRQERPVEDRRVGRAGEDQVDLAVALARALQEHAVDEGRGEEPGHEARVLDRVPAPVSAPAERLVGPVAAHQDRGSQRQEGQERPRKRPRDPAVPALLPERRDRKGERDREGREPDEHDRRMDDHPGVLEERIQADAVLRRGRGQQLERALLAEDRDDPEEGREVDDHHRGFLLLGAPPDEEPDDGAPEAPQEEGALLAGPEGRDQEVERQVGRRVGVDVGHVEPVLQQERHQDRRRDDDAGRKRRVGRSREGQELLAPPVDQEIDERRGEAREQRAPDRRHPGPDVHQLFWAGAAGCAA